MTGTVDPFDLDRLVRAIPDFPEPGIMFRDISPLLASPVGFARSVDALVDGLAASDVDLVVGIESRGFIFAGPVALRLGAGFVLARKAGKLPAATQSFTYDLEYGTSTLELHADAIADGDRVLVVDDVLATGGTAAATVSLVRRLGGEVVGLRFLGEIGALAGRRKLSGLDVASAVIW